MLCDSIKKKFKLHFLIFILKVSRCVLISDGSGTRNSGFWVPQIDPRSALNTCSKTRKLEFRAPDPNPVPIISTDDILLSCSDVSKPGRCF